jgi:hypothetical protein
MESTTRGLIEVSCASLRNWSVGILEWWNNGFKKKEDGEQFTTYQPIR